MRQPGPSHNTDHNGTEQAIYDRSGHKPQDIALVSKEDLQVIPGDY